MYIFCQPVQTGADGAALTGPAALGSLLTAGKQLFISKAQQAAVVLPLILGVVVVQGYAQICTVIGGGGRPPFHTAQGVDGAPVVAGRSFGLALIQAAQQQVQEGEVIAQRKAAPQAVQCVDAAAQPAVGGAVALLCFVRKRGLIGHNITKHGRSALFDELGAAARAGDLDAAAATGHTQLLAALGAAVVVVELAVGPLILQTAELTVYAVLQGIVLVVLLRALGNVAAERAVVAQHQQHQTQPCEQAEAGEQRDQQQHDGRDAQKLVQAIGTVAADHKLTEFFSHNSCILCFGIKAGAPAVILQFLGYQSTMMKF